MVGRLRLLLLYFHELTHTRLAAAGVMGPQPQFQEKSLHSVDPTGIQGMIAVLAGHCAEGSHENVQNEHAEIVFQTIFAGTARTIRAVVVMPTQGISLKR